MAESARILATEAMAEAKAALAEFASSVDRTLAEVDSEIMRMTQWLQQDRPAHWKREVRVRQEEVHKAKAAVARRELAAAPEPARAVEERRGVERAERRLDEAQRRQAATHRWAPVWEKEAMAYKGPAHQLRDMVSGAIPAAIGRISRMMESVESYLRVTPPKGDSNAPLPGVKDQAMESPEEGP